MKYNATYINLERREDRKVLMQRNWEDIVNLSRFPAIEAQVGGHGNYASHRVIIETMPNDSLTIIMEDDIIPCNDFENSLDLAINSLPKDWDMLMVGHFTSDRTKSTKLSDYIHKAEDHVVASHCYIVNPLSREKVMAEFSNKRNDKNIDVMLLNIQKYAYVCMAMPSLCYQYQSFSDNSKCNDDIVYKGTIRYFKDNKW